jgi:hypothetical protein
MTIFIYFLKLTPMPVRVESFVADLDRWLCLYGHRDYYITPLRGLRRS